MPTTISRIVFNKSIIISLACSLAVSSVFSNLPTAAKNLSSGITYQLRVADKTLQTGQYKKAEAEYTQILAKSPNNIEARTGLAFAQAELYKLGAAEKNAMQVLQKDATNAMAYATLGIVARNRTASSDMEYQRQKGKLLQDSVNYLQQAINYGGESPEVLTQLGKTYRIQDNFSESRRVLERALQLDPDYSEALVNLGITQMEAGDINGAIASYQKAISFNSKDYNAHFRLGEAYLKQGDPHKALTTLNTALALNKDHAGILTTMAEANLAQGNEAAATSNFQKAIFQNPGYMPAHTGLAKFYDNRGDEEFAMATLKNALSINPTFNEGRNKLGELALRVGKTEQAMRYFQESLNINPHDAQALNGMSKALTLTAHQSAQDGYFGGQNSKLVDAEATIDEALRYSPNSLQLHLAKLRVNQLSGKPALAESELRQITQMQARNDIERLMQSQAFFALGDLTQSDQIASSMIQYYAQRRDTQQLLLIGDTLAADRNLLMAKQAYQAVPVGNKKAERAINIIEKMESESQKDLRLAQALNRKGPAALFSSKQKQSALDFYQDTLSKNPRQPEVRLELAKLYEKFDMNSEAIRSYQLYLGMSPQLEAKEVEKIQKKIQKLQAG